MQSCRLLLPALGFPIIFTSRHTSPPIRGMNRDGTQTKLSIQSGSWPPLHPKPLLLPPLLQVLTHPLFQKKSAVAERLVSSCAGESNSPTPERIGSSDPAPPLLAGSGSSVLSNAALHPENPRGRCFLILFSLSEHPHRGAIPEASQPAAIKPFRKQRPLRKN